MDHFAWGPRLLFPRGRRTGLVLGDQLYFAEKIIRIRMVSNGYGPSSLDV